MLVIIDAVDESLSRLDLRRAGRDLVTDSRFEAIRLLATSREYYDIETHCSAISVMLPMNNAHVQEDILLYVKSAIASNTRFRTWPQSLTTLAENDLSKGAKTALMSCMPTETRYSATRY